MTTKALRRDDRVTTGSCNVFCAAALAFTAACPETCPEQAAPSHVDRPVLGADGSTVGLRSADVTVIANHRAAMPEPSAHAHWEGAASREDNWARRDDALTTP